MNRPVLFMSGTPPTPRPDGYPSLIYLTSSLPSPPGTTLAFGILFCRGMLLGREMGRNHCFIRTVSWVRDGCGWGPLEVMWNQLIYINRCQRWGGKAGQIYRVCWALTLKDWLQMKRGSIESNWWLGSKWPLHLCNLLKKTCIYLKINMHIWI